MKLIKLAKIATWASPFLVAIFTVISLYASNADRLNPGQMVTPMVFALAIAGIVLLLFWLLPWTSRSAPFPASVFTGCFLLWNIAPWWVFILIMAAVTWATIWGKEKINKPTSFFISIVVTVGIIVSAIQAGLMFNNWEYEGSELAGDYLEEPGQPNIYFIVPDRMPSPEALRQSGIDPDDMIRDLEAQGFYVPESMISEDTYRPDYEGEVYTTRTMRFFAAVLNDGEELPLDISYEDCRQMIREGSVFTTLHEKGYRITNVASWFNETATFSQADVNLEYEDISFLERIFRNELSVTFYERTIFAGLNFRILESEASQFRVESGRHNWQDQTLTELASSGLTSQFAIAHIMLPHEPFIYTIPAAGSQMNKYKDQIRWAMLYITSLATRIREADPTAIIIIQSDEGMAFQKPVELNYDLTLTQWNGVFTAWYLPGLDIDLAGVDHNDILHLVVSGKT